MSTMPVSSRLQGSKTRSAQISQIT